MIVSFWLLWWVIISLWSILLQLGKSHDYLAARSPFSKAIKRLPFYGEEGHQEELPLRPQTILSSKDELSEKATDEGLIGLRQLPMQIRRKAKNNVFTFSLMVVGGSGLGKSTLVNSLFYDIYNDKHPGPSMRGKKTLKVESMTKMISESNVNVMLTIVDTPGFGDSLDNTRCWQSIVDYIEKRHFDYLNCELYLPSRLVVDHRIHCCLYFIQPTGHSLKTIDIELMRHLHDKVNIIPVIGKADTLTSDELAQFKRNVSSTPFRFSPLVYLMLLHTDTSGSR